jgi:MFS family permease
MRRPNARKRENGDASKTQWPLLSLNFFMADFQTGITPFLGVFLLLHGWNAGLIGTVMTIGGIAGMLVSIPAGALIDHIRYKRAAIIVPGACTVAASAMILLSQNFWVVATSQVATAIAGATVVPAINSITLGIVKQAGFLRQNGRNQTANHAGNMIGAGLSGLLGWQFGYSAVFVLAILFGFFSLVSVLMIPAKSIDYQAARGATTEQKSSKSKRSSILLKYRPLLVLAMALAAFQFGNGGLLPLYSLAVVSHTQSNGPLFVAATMVIAQGTMVFAAIFATRFAESKGYWLALLVSFAALPVRALLAAGVLTPWAVVPVQILDGIGAGIQGVAVPGLVARILNGTGHVNVGQGAVTTVQGVGAALSPAIGGWIAQFAGYQTAFFLMGSTAAVSITIWAIFYAKLKAAEANQHEASVRKRGRMAAVVQKALRIRHQAKSEA